MDKLIHDIRCALDIIIVCTYIQEDETEKSKKKFFFAENDIMIKFIANDEEYKHKSKNKILV